MLETLNETLLTAPTEAWSGLAGVVIGSVISIFGVWLTNRNSINHLQIQLSHERASHAEDTKREKLEELYTLVGNWLNALANHSLTLAGVMKGKISYNDYLDLINGEDFKPKYDYSRLEMIIDIYATELKSEYEKVINSRSDLNSIAIEHKVAYERGDLNGEKYLRPYIAAQIKLEEHGEALKLVIAKLAARA